MCVVMVTVTMAVNRRLCQQGFQSCCNWNKMLLNQDNGIVVIKCNFSTLRGIYEGKLVDDNVPVDGPSSSVSK